MRFVNVMILPAATVAPELWDFNALVLLLGKKVAKVYGCSKKGREARKMGNGRLRVETTSALSMKLAGCGSWSQPVRQTVLLR